MLALDSFVIIRHVSPYGIKFHLAKPLGWSALPKKDALKLHMVRCDPVSCVSSSTLHHDVMMAPCDDMKTCVRQKCQNDSLTKILARKTFFERATQHKSAKLQKALFKTLESYKLKQVTKWYLFLSSVKVMWKLRYVYCPIRSIFSIATILTLWFQTVHRITQALFQ